MNRFIKRSISCLVAVVLVLSFFSFAPSFINAAETVKVTIMATSDEHGNIYPIDYYTLQEKDRGLAKVYTLVKKVRAENPNSILISNGDTIQGTPLVYYFTKVETDKTHPMAVAMNTMGYDAMVVGNHEIQDYGWDELQKFSKDAEFPVLSANLVDESTQEVAMTPYVIKEVNGVKVGILGLTTVDTNTYTPSYNLKGHKFVDAVETAGKYIEELRPQVDILVVSAHMGFEFGSDTKTFTYVTPSRVGNDADKIIQAYPEIDVLITGHDHYNISPFIRNGVLCVQPGYWGQALAKIDITLEKTEDGYKIKDKQGVNLAVDKTVEAAPEVLEATKEYHDKAVEYVKSPIGEATDDFDGTLARIQDNALMDLIHKVQLDATKEFGTTLSIAAMLPGTPPVWEKGPISVMDAYSLYIYDNTLWVEEISGKDLRDALEVSYSYYNQYDFGTSDTPLVNPNIRGYNFDTVQGVDYVIDISKPIGQRVVSLTYRGVEVSDDDTFKIAVNNHRGGGNGGYKMFSEDKAIWKSTEEIRNYIIEYVKKEGTITPEVDNNWKILPDYLLLDGRADVDILVRKDVLKGYPPVGELLLDREITRAEFATMIVRSFPYEFIPWVGLKTYSFKDTPSTFWASPYIEALARRGVVKGFGDGTFRPNKKVSQQEAATILLRAMGKDSGSLEENLETIYKMGIFGPVTDKPLYPNNPVTRLETARMIATVRFPVVTILHTNDFHMHLLSDTDATTKKPIGGSARISTFVDSVRAYNPRTLLVDAGDNIGGGPPIGQFFYGKNVIETYNAIGYDLATFGNHEFDWGTETLKERMSEATFDYVSANVIDTGTKSTFADAPYVIKTFGFLNIGFTGVDTVDLPILVNPTGIENISVTDPVSAINAVTGELQGKTHYNVVLSHMGYDVDKVFADKISNVNLIIGGHSHTLLKTPDVVNGIPIVQTGSYGYNVGKVVLEFTVSPSGAKLDNFRYSLVPITDSFSEDPKIKAIIDPYNAELSKKMDEVIGEALVDLDGERGNVRTKETNLGDFIADWMKEISDADITIINGGGIRASIKKGPITVGSVYTALPFDNYLVLIEITGKQVIDALENGFSQVETAQGKFPQISGIRVKVNLKKPAGSRVVEVLVGDEPIELDKVYKVVTNDFMAAGGDGYVAFKGAKSSRSVTGNFMRDDLVDYIRANPKVEATVDGRITYVESE